MYFDHAPKHMIRLSVEYRQDLKIPIRLWNSLVGDTPSVNVCIVHQLEINRSESDSNYIVIAVVWTLLFFNIENDF